MTQLGIFHEPPAETRNRERFWWATFALVATATFLLGQFWVQGEHLTRGPANEFLLTYGAASVVGSADIYALDGLAYRHTPLTALAALPLTWLPYASAYWVWTLLGIWSVVGFIALWRPPTSRWTLIAVACSAPLFAGFLDGRETPFLLLGLGAAVLWARSGKPVHAGFALTLCALQWQLFLLVPLLLLVQRRWHMMAGAAAGLAGAATATMAVSGVDWPLGMLAAWNAFPTSSGSTPTLAAALAGVPQALELRWGIALVLAALTWSAGRRLGLEAGLGLALAAGLLLSPRAELADAVVLLPAALTAASQARLRTLRAFGLVLLTPIPYLLGGPEHTSQVLVAAVLALLGLTALDALGHPASDTESAQTGAAAPTPQAS